MRPSCLGCVLKHIAQASILLDETRLGYPLHYWLAVGHLAEAESEVLGFSQEVATAIREARLGLDEKEPSLDVEGLIRDVLYARDAKS